MWELFVLTVALCVLGAFTNVIMWARKPEDIASFEAVKTLVLGFVVGVVWYFARVEHGVPDSLLCFVVGYSSEDIVNAITARVKRSMNTSRKRLAAHHAAAH